MPERIAGAATKSSIAADRPQAGLITAANKAVINPLFKAHDVAWAGLGKTPAVPRSWLRIGRPRRFAGRARLGNKSHGTRSENAGARRRRRQHHGAHHPQSAATAWLLSTSTMPPTAPQRSEKMSTKRYGLVISDWNMGPMTGYELLREGARQSEAGIDAVHHGDRGIEDRKRDRGKEGRREQLYRQAVQRPDAQGQDRNWCSPSAPASSARPSSHTFTPLSDGRSCPLSPESGARTAVVE